MVLIMKKNKNKDIILKLFSLIIFSLLIIWVIFCGIQYKKNYTRNVNAHNQLVELCNEKSSTISEETCGMVISNGKPVMPDTFTVFFQLLINSNLSLIQLIAPMIVILLASCSFSHEYSTGFYKNKLIRMSYKEYFKYIILKTYQCIWILPAFIILIFICSFIISGHFDVNLTLSYWPENYIPVSISIVKNAFPFMIIFLLNIVFSSLFYANLSLIPIRKSNNYIVSVISSYLLFIFCDIFLEVLVGVLLLEKYAHISQASAIFSLFNCWVYDSIPSIPLFTIYCFLLAVISFIVVICIYHNIEEVIIDSEK